MEIIKQINDTVKNGVNIRYYTDIEQHSLTVSFYNSLDKIVNAISFDNEILQTAFKSHVLKIRTLWDKRKHDDMPIIITGEKNEKTVYIEYCPALFIRKNQFQKGISDIENPEFDNIKSIILPEIMSNASVILIFTYGKDN